MQRHRVLVLSCSILVLACGLSGCSMVTTTKPLPLTAAASDQEKFEGSWMISDGTVSLRFAANGVAQIAGLDWDQDAGLFTLERCELYLCEGEHAGFISVRCKEKGEWEDEYLFFRYHFTPDDTLVLWQPQPSVFKEAIEDGVLQGTVHEDELETSITITGDPNKLLELIDVEDDLSLFDYVNPMVIRKLSGPE